MDSGYLVQGELDHYVVVVSGMLEGIGRVAEIQLPADGQADVICYYRDGIRLLLQGMRAR
ncbi:hypothetical protein D3C73_1324990 [compost metagenome]